MKLKQLYLKNFRGFTDSRIKFKSQTTVIIGQNGAGKTTILDSIAICMTHFTGKLFSSTEGYNIDAWFTAQDITNSVQKGLCSITLEDSNCNNGEEFVIEVSKNRAEKGLKFDRQPDSCITSLKDKLRENRVSSLPIIAYFNVHRTYPAKEQSKVKRTYNNLLFAYDRSLALKSPSFSTFERWFNQQIVEENAYKIEKKDFDIELPSLKYIRLALNKFLSNIQPNTYGEIHIKTESSTLPDFDVNTNQHIVIEKNGNEFLLNQLSEGERMVITLVAEISRRLVLANKENPLNGDGIVLIDEIELHLHPNWQKLIIHALEKTFPNISFVVTSHSPLILSSLRKSSIKVFNNFTEIPNSELPDIYTATSDEVLDRLMMADDSFNPFEEKLQEIDLLFNEMKFEKAYEILQKIKTELNSNPEWLVDYEERLDFARK
jgi:predicted ATP-binding protein involved in virulence